MAEPKSSIVTYRGATDGSESDAFVIPTDDGDVVFARNQTVRDVPKAIRDVLKENSATHRFEYGEPDTGAAAPWEGYDDQTADEITAQLAEPGFVHLAEDVVAYESAHDGRKTVIEAAEEIVPEKVNGEGS